MKGGGWSSLEPWAASGGPGRLSSVQEPVLPCVEAPGVISTFLSGGGWAVVS